MGILRYNPLVNTSLKSAGVKLLYVTYSKYEKDWQSLPHIHHFTELCYVLGGHGSYLIENEEFPIVKNDFIIINSNISHTEKSAEEAPLEYIILGIEGLDFSSANGSDHVIFNCSGKHIEFSFYMKSLLSEMQEKQKGYELVCSSLLDILITKLLRRPILVSESIPVAKANRECLKLKQYIDSNYPRQITLDSLAAISHLNKYYLVHAFTKIFGCSPINYLFQVRIKASKELLSSTNLSITEIAHASGFSSQSYFAQCFLKHCKMTASEYRKLCSENRSST